MTKTKSEIDIMNVREINGVIGCFNKNMRDRGLRIKYFFLSKDGPLHVYYEVGKDTRDVHLDLGMRLGIDFETKEIENNPGLIQIPKFREIQSMIRKRSYAKMSDDLIGNNIYVEFSPSGGGNIEEILSVNFIGTIIQEVRLGDNPIARRYQDIVKAELSKQSEVKRAVELAFKIYDEVN